MRHGAVIAYGEDMRPETVDELLRRSRFGGWTWYLWAVTFVLGTCVLAFVTFRRGLVAVLTDPSDFFLLAISVIAVIVFLRAPPTQTPKNREVATLPPGLGQQGDPNTLRIGRDGRLCRSLDDDQREAAFELHAGRPQNDADGAGHSSLFADHFSEVAGGYR